MVIHSGEKAFSCNLCEKVFKHKSNLNRHMVIHSGEKGFSCNLCEKAFAEKGTLKKHMVIHSGEKGFSCNLCKICKISEIICSEELLEHPHVDSYWGESIFLQFM